MFTEASSLEARWDTAALAEYLYDNLGVEEAWMAARLGPRNLGPVVLRWLCRWVVLDNMGARGLARAIGG